MISFATKYSANLCFRLTIRNVNYGMVPEGITVHNSFRLTIRNVNLASSIPGIILPPVLD